ncbi:MAG: hypothetical protein CMH62_02450 [Nanoarchaeota archaeon]|nr:hypothetical protein [Nanoarchaeota archaeon]|tara:strand:- start:2923 stop:3321 length:399 start_codon:yes stop_codon:yes gene_type:complete
MSKNRDPAYIALISSQGAIEVDCYLNGRDIGFDGVREMREILSEYPIGPHEFNYMIPLLRVFKNNSDKEFSDFIPDLLEELELERRLIITDLEDVPSNTERLEDLRSVLVDISNVFLEEHSRDPREIYGLVA